MNPLKWHVKVVVSRERWIEVEAPSGSAARIQAASCQDVITILEVRPHDGCLGATLPAVEI